MFRIKKNFIYQLLFALCVGVTYLNNYELTFAVWILVTMITIKQSYSLEIIRYVSIFLGILGIAFVVALFKDYFLYNYFRDISYLLKPIIGLLLGYNLCRNENIKPFYTIVYTGVFIAIIHLGIILYSVAAYRILNIHKLREYGGYFSDFEIYSLLITIYSRRFKLQFSKNRKIIILLILSVSSFLYLSRTNFLQFLIFYMAMQGFFKINKRSITIIGSLVVFIILLYTVLFNMKFSRNGKGLEALFFKIKNAPIEAFKSRVDKDDWQDLNDNYRSYEKIITLKQVGREPAGPAFGKGLGSTVDLGKQFWSNDGEFIRYLPTLHNGFITVYLKAGLAGLILYLLFHYYLCRLPKTRDDYISQINLLVLGTGIFLFLSSWVLLGLYYKTENKSIIIGFIICFRQMMIKQGQQKYDTQNLQ